MMKQVFLQPGDMHVATEPTKLVTVLGSCVALCIHDPALKIGAMCHFFLPTFRKSADTPLVPPGDSNRYGEFVIPNMLRAMKKLGCGRETMTVRVIGGAHVMDGEVGAGSAVGTANVELAMALIAKFGLNIIGRSVGGSASRKVHFFSGSGEVRVKNVLRTPASAVTVPKISKPFSAYRDAVVAIGASTGGTEAVKEVVRGLRHCPPMVIVLHIPPFFSNAYAGSLNRLVPFEVKEAADGDEVRSGRILIAPGGQQMAVNLEHGRLLVRITDDPPVNRFRPSVDYLFASLAQINFRRLVAVVMTGMGADGARGLLALKERGAITIVQDEGTSTVYGMPKAAKELGAACWEAALPDIAARIEASVGVGPETAAARGLAAAMGGSHGGE